MLWRMVQSPAWNQSQAVHPRGQYCEEYIVASLLIIWVMGKNIPSAGLQVMKNWRMEWMISQVTVLLFWGTLKGWRNGMAGISWNSSLGNTKPCAWGGIILCTSAHCGCLTGNQLYEKRHEGPGGGDQASNASSQQRRPTAAGVIRGGVLPAPFLSFCSAPVGHVYCQVHSWGPQYKWDTEILKLVQWRGTKMIEAWSIWYKIVNILWTGKVNSTKTCNCCLI